ncbi:MAG: hypothetical protein KIS94_09840 [Chitinophagales bacterium]|nr:hypothetical protein [Chitinophagales bacterium]
MAHKPKPQLSSYKPEQIRDGIFSLNTRRFGTVAESLIKILANASWGQNINHDLYDAKEMKRIEVKFSRALASNKHTIKDDNILEQIINADDKARMFNAKDWKKHSFDCNIQQIKRKEFEILYYGIFFADKVQVFKITPQQIDRKINYSDKQHKGNIGEGQFHINNLTYQYHLDNFLEIELTYAQILRKLLLLQKAGKLKTRILAVILSIVTANENY